jgi:3-hydroxy acid dehydrogenase / malonic semialdehyde reductase
MSKPIVLITGATAGIGEAVAGILANNNFDLILTGRRRDRLEKISSRLEKLTRVHTLCFDVRERDQVDNAIDSLPPEWQNVKILVNNAGLAAGFDVFQEGSIDDWEQMIDTNVKGLLYMSRKLVPGMIERKQGHIINVSSIAGREVYERGNIYCATKYSVEAISNGMRIDLVKHNIKVSVISPGMTETEFFLVRFKGDREKAKAPLKGVIPLSPGDVAEAVLFMVTRPPHVSVHDMLLMPAFQASVVYTSRSQ